MARCLQIKDIWAKSFLRKLKDQSMEIFTKVKKNMKKKNTRASSTILFKQQRIN